MGGITISMGVKDVINKKKKYDTTVSCPSCGKHVPKGLMCRECGANLGPKGRLSLKKIYLMIFFLGIIGFVLLYYAYYQATYVTPIEEVVYLDEGETIRVSGKVIELSYDDRYEKTLFKIEDATGTIEIFGWSDFTSDLRDTQRLPGIGDNITAEGTVSIYKDTRSLELSSTDSYDIITEDPEDLAIGDILLNNLNDKVQIFGQVIDREISYYGTEINHVFLTVRDTTGSIKVYITGDHIALVEKYAIIPEVNHTVEITGMVSEYRGELEIIPSTPTSEDIVIIGVPVLHDWDPEEIEEKYIPSYVLSILMSSGIITIGIAIFIIIPYILKKKLMTKSNSANVTKVEMEGR